ncbi:MAG: ABC transporter permease [Candidatus Bipolaricaulota bacterium]|nr:ABC transporter permease [Candidatus Bipolaricaulota bacterium]
MRGFAAVFLAQLRIFLRNPVDLLVTAVLPLALVLLFGFIWGRGERPTRVGVVLLADGELLQSVLAEFPELAPQTYPEAWALEQAVARRAVDFGLIWDGRELTVLLAHGRVQENPGFAAWARRVARALERRRAGVPPPVRPVKVHVGKLSAATWYDHIVPGLMAVALLQAGVFAVAGRLAAMRERGILRRLQASPVPGWAVLAGVGLLRLGVGFATAGLNLALAQALFGAAFSPHVGRLLFYGLAAGLGGMGLGAALTALARRPGSAATLGSVLVQAMVFLSGIYIPFEFLPPGLRAVGQILPAYHLAQGMRAALGVVEPAPSAFLAGLGFALFGILAFWGFGRRALRPESRA